MSVKTIKSRRIVHQQALLGQYIRRELRYQVNQIGFVGLMVPHLARAIAGVRHGGLVATSALIGAILLLASDLVSRVALAPQELPVGIVTSALGAAFVLTLVLRR